MPTPRRFSTISVALTSLAFTYLFFAEYLSPFRKIHVPADLWGYHYPLMDAAFQSLQRFSFPAWDAAIYCGQPLAANLQTALFYPPTWILFAISAARGHLTYGAMQWFIFAHIWLGFLLFFCWLRNKGLSDLACILGAGVFAYSGYAMLQLQHLGLICGYVWLPLGLWGIDEINQGKRLPGFLKIVACSAAAFLAGYPPTWFVLVVYLSTYTLFSGKLAALTHTCLAVIVSLALSAVQLLPTIEASALMVKENRYGLGFKNPAFYLSYLVPNFYDFGIDVSVHKNQGQEYLYLGAPALFGLAVLFKYRPWRPVIPVLAAGCACLIFLTNPLNLVWTLISHVQILAQVCRDWYFLAGITAAVAGLAAIGIDRFLISGGEGRSSKALAIVGATCAAAWAVYEIHAWWPDAPAFQSGWRSALDAAATLLVFSFCIFALRKQSGQWRTAMIVVVVLCAAVDYKAFGTSKRVNGDRGELHDVSSKDEFFAMNTDAYRQLVEHREYRILLDQTGPNSVDLRHYGLTTPQGFDPFIAQRYRDIIKDLGATILSDREFTFDAGNDLAFQTLGIRYIITSDQGPLFSHLRDRAAFTSLGTAPSYYRVFEYQKFSAPFNWPQEVKLLLWSPEIRRFRVNSSQGAEFVLKEQFFPGWIAYLDGNPVPIQLWQGVFQSIEVPAGEHALEFRYQSRMLKIGAWISATVALLALFASLAPLRQTLFPSLSKR